MKRTRSLNPTHPLSRLSRIVPFEGEGDDNDSNPNPNGNPDVQKQIQEAVDAATEGLKRTNASMKEEKTALKTEFDTFRKQIEGLGGADGIKAIMKQREELMKSEEGQLLAEGKYEEWYDFRVNNMKADHQSQLETFQTQIAERDTRVADTMKRLERTLLKTEVATARAEAGCLDDAGVMEDITNAAEKVFEYDADRNAMVIRNGDEGVEFGKDGKNPKTLAEWLHEQQKSRRHWWGKSRGGGADGSEDPNFAGGENNPWAKDNWNLTDQGAFIKAHGIEAAEQMAKAAGTVIGGVRQ